MLTRCSDPLRLALSTAVSKDQTQTTLAGMKPRPPDTPAEATCTPKHDKEKEEHAVRKQRRKTELRMGKKMAETAFSLNVAEPIHGRSIVFFTGLDSWIHCSTGFTRIQQHVKGAEKKIQFNFWMQLQL